MDKQCVVCHVRPALFRCIQCHKPVCDECAFKTEHGAFCGRNCATAYRDFQKAQGDQPVKKSGGLVTTLIAFLVAVAVLGFVAHRLGLLSGLLGGR
ncbi:MAG: hypothetical protein GXY85_02270 [Candidatus Brocadiaceae bacterium]|nr:hypothetical protein [Candidatus Brocadiaceae bacterium]